MWLSSNKTLFKKTGSGPDVAHRLQFASLWSLAVFLNCLSSGHLLMNIKIWLTCPSSGKEGRKYPPGEDPYISHISPQAKFNFNQLLLKCWLGLPWWYGGWQSACQCRGHRFKPWSGRIPHAAEQLGPWATITEPARLEPVLRNKRGHDSERPAHRDEEWPSLATTRESPRTETKTQHSHKLKKKILLQ